MPQAVEQAAGVDHEDAQRIAKRRRQRWRRRSRLNCTRRMTFWRGKGGADLESALQVDPEHGDSPVALIDARFIGRAVEARRQDPPPAGPPKGGVHRPRDGQAAAEGNGDGLRVIAVSHPWQPDHPDPKEVNLTLLAKVLERFIKEKGVRTVIEKVYTYACLL